MSGYDFDRPFIAEDNMEYFEATDKREASKYGKTVKATDLTNIEYKTRFNALKHKINMKPPPSCGRIFPGYLVVRKLNSKAQYETWMPDHVFEEIYNKTDCVMKEITKVATHHSLNSSYREKIIEHLFIGELLKLSWVNEKYNIEISKPEVDNSGYDLIIEANKIIRHIQLKATYLGAKTSRQNIHISLGEKQSGCVIWIYFNEKNLELGPFLFYGSKGNKPLPSLGNFKVAKHSKNNASGEKSKRPNIRVINKGSFTKYQTVSELYDVLFG